jgi:hypothetical protein
MFNYYLSILNLNLFIKSIIVINGCSICVIVKTFFLMMKIQSSNFVTEDHLLLKIMKLDLII